MPRWLVLLALVLAAMAASLLLAVVIPRDADTSGPTPILTTTQTIPAAPEP